MEPQSDESPEQNDATRGGSGGPRGAWGAIGARGLLQGQYVARSYKLGKIGIG